MEDFIRELEGESKDCLSGDVIKVLRNTSLKVVRGIKVREDTYIKLPNGLVAVIPSTQLPYIWLNILHIYCFGDYIAYDEFVPRDDWVIIDLGASVGLYTLYVAKLASKGLVVAVEPSSLPRKYLRMNVEINDLSNVSISRYAVAPRSGRIKLYVTKYWATTSAIEEYAKYMGEVVKTEWVEAVTLDELIKYHGLSKVDLLKLDVEGLELGIIKSSKSIAEGRIKRLVIEVHKNVVDPNEVIRYLRTLNYSVSLHDVGLENQVFIYAITQN